MDIDSLKSKAKNLEPVIRIGKNGLTENVLSEIKKHLKKRKLIKVKFLRAFIDGKDKKAIAMKLAQETGGVLVEQVGFVAVLAKKFK